MKFLDSVKDFFGFGELSEDVKRQNERVKELVGELYTKDAKGNVEPRDGVTASQLYFAINTLSGINKEYDKISKRMQNLNKEIDEHENEVAETKGLMLSMESKYNVPFPDWMRKAWRLE